MHICACLFCICVGEDSISSRIANGSCRVRRPRRTKDHVPNGDGRWCRGEHCSSVSRSQTQNKCNLQKQQVTLIILEQTFDKILQNNVE